MRESREHGSWEWLTRSVTQLHGTGLVVGCHRVIAVQMAPGQGPGGPSLGERRGNSRSASGSGHETCYRFAAALLLLLMVAENTKFSKDEGKFVATRASRAATNGVEIRRQRLVPLAARSTNRVINTAGLLVDSHSPSALPSGRPTVTKWRSTMGTDFRV